MKGIIIYKGKYGATQQYAEWLGSELKLPVAMADRIRGDSLMPYDFLLIGTSVYIGKLQIERWLKKNRGFIGNKKIFFFQVAATPPEERVKRQVYNESGIPKELVGNCQFYFLPGRMIMKKLSWLDSILLKMGAKLTKDPTEKKTMVTDYDNVRKEHIADILLSVKKLLNQVKVAIPEKIVAAV